MVSNKMLKLRLSMNICSHVPQYNNIFSLEHKHAKHILVGGDRCEKKCNKSKPEANSDSSIICLAVTR